MLKFDIDSSISLGVMAVLEKVFFFFQFFAYIFLTKIKKNIHIFAQKTFKKSLNCITKLIFCKYHPNSLKSCSNIFNLKFQRYFNTFFNTNIMAALDFYFIFTATFSQYMCICNIKTYTSYILNASKIQHWCQF